ncbi:MAG: L-threonylcarbamoyladenylate synthase [Defluviitaleaceae bacterium]|nr:L-threonylcarbamoyladenylate synthase [Defluviitaleaceae bacterium]
MKTKLKIANDEGIKEAAYIIKNYGLVAFPTETVYGLGANALCERSAGKIFEAKGRPADNPLIVHVSSIDMLTGVVESIPEYAYKLIEKFWPGPITLIFKKKSIIPDFVSGGLNTIGVRIPNNRTALELIKEAGVPIAAPSANTSGKPSPTTAAHVMMDLDGKIDMVLDGGNCVFGLESTIVDLSGDASVLLRPGAITVEMLEEAIGQITIQTELLKSDDAPKSPGMKYKHYSPNAKLTIIKCKNSNRIIDFIKQKADANFKKSAVIATEESLYSYKAAGLNAYALSAEGLFATLRKIDDDKVEEAYVHSIEESGIGLAIMNRLKKAADSNIIDLDS